MCYQPVYIKDKKGKLFRGCNPDGELASYIWQKVACGQCLECRQVRATGWALRCMAEAGESPHNAFITMTYSDEHNPIVLLKEHLQKFKKDLRFELDGKRKRNGLPPIQIKTFDCGEYGEQNHRPHFHALIFGYDFPDKYIERHDEKGRPIYNSATLERLWGKGLTTVQDVTKHSAGYCALYSSEPKNKLPPHLRNHPEFNTMSRGLGIAPLLRNMETYLKTDEIFWDGRAHQIPEILFDKYFGENKKLNREYLRIKANRQRQSVRTEHLAEHKLGRGEDSVLMQKQHRAESAKKRSTKPL